MERIGVTTSWFGVGMVLQKRNDREALVPIKYLEPRDEIVHMLIAHLPVPRFDYPSRPHSAYDVHYTDRHNEFQNAIEDRQ